ncbi:MAG: uroporphyrinogen decarboxylase family protein [Armatimonadota bacterium]|nr:uroporphyrinogen decarboxylase family protein [Armatimonadota bacterium]
MRPSGGPTGHDLARLWTDVGYWDQDMDSRQRLLTTLDHREPDRVPFDLGSTQVTGIHILAYRRLRQYVDLPPVEPQVCDAIQQLAMPDYDLLARFQVDVRGLFPLNSHNWGVVAVDAGDAWEYTDEWGITHRRPKPDGLYYSIVRSPLDRATLSPADIRSYRWPHTGDPQRIAGLRQQAETYRAQGKAVMVKGVLAGIVEMAQRVRGMENFLVDMASDEALACAMLDKMVELKLAFWEMALPRLADVVDIVSEADDYGTQTSQLISPAMFRRLVKPRLKVLLSRIKHLAPSARLFFHSCGNVRPLIPDFIELGVDILNPVHIGATGMEPAALKRDFGRDITFWGGGVDTQGVLPCGSPQQVRDDVKRNIEALAPGGGFVFATVHNILPDVPPQNIVAMWEALQEFGRYR